MVCIVFLHEFPFSFFSLFFWLFLDFLRTNWLFQEWINFFQRYSTERRQWWLQNGLSKSVWIGERSCKSGWCALREGSYGKNFQKKNDSNLAKFEKIIFFWNYKYQNLQKKIKKHEIQKKFIFIFKKIPEFQRFFFHIFLIF